MSRVRTAVVYSSLAQYSSRVLSFVSIVIIARLLTPEELGIFAIAGSLVLLASEVRLLGATNYVVREPELTPAKIRAAHGLTVLISFGLGVALMLSAPMLADFYEITDVEYITYILAISFFLAPYTSLITSILARDLNYRTLFYMRVPAQFVSVGTSIGLAYLGYSYYALAWGLAAEGVASLALALLCRPAALPFAPTLRGSGAVLRFGAYSSAAGILVRGVVALPDLIIGKMGSAAQVALYSRGLGLIDFGSNIVVTGMGGVALPYFAQIRRDGGNVADAYVRTMAMVCTALWPGLALTSVVSLPLLHVVFGEQWYAAAPIASVLALWGCLHYAHWFSSGVLMATGNERHLLIGPILAFVATGAAVYLAFPLGMVAMAWSMTAAAALEFVAVTLVLMGRVGISARALSRALLPVVVVTACCWLAATYVIAIEFVENAPFVTQLVVTSSAVVVVWLLNCLMFKLQLLREMLQILGLSRR